MLRTLCCLILTVSLTMPVSAQRIEKSHVARPAPDTGMRAAPKTLEARVNIARDDAADPIAAMLLSGLMLGAAGMFGGGYLGYQAEVSRGCGSDDWFCGVGGAILGGLIGETVGVTTGIHLAGEKRNSYAGDLGVGLGIAAIGVAAAPVTYGISLLAVPVTQLFVGIRRELKPKDQ